MDVGDLMHAHYFRCFTMEPNFQTTDSSSPSSSMDPMLSGVSLQSLLSLNPSLFAHAFPSLTDHHTPTPDPKKLLIPKTEHLPLIQPFNFFPNFQPYLHSPDPPFAKRHRLHFPHPHPSPDSAPTPSPALIPQSNLARQRRQKLSEKTRCLQKLMPWDKKMDQATLLEEAYKYVKFLQAQLCVLQSMPSSSPSHSLTPSHVDLIINSAGNAVFGDLQRLNRSQVLQVLVNSPVAQTMLCSQGFCVFSFEQLPLLSKLSVSDNAFSSKTTFFN